jgi:transcription elongation factor Elf1
MARRRIERHYPFQEIRVPGTVTREKDCSRWVFICPRCNWSKTQTCPDPKAKRIGHYCYNCHLPFLVYVGYDDAWKDYWT